MESITLKNLKEDILNFCNAHPELENQQVFTRNSSGSGLDWVLGGIGFTTAFASREELSNEPITASIFEFDKDDNYDELDAMRLLLYEEEQTIADIEKIIILE